MPTVRLRVPSTVLGTTTAISAVLPQTHHEAGSLVPTVYLLHGLGGGDRSWLDHSDVERLAAERGIAVVLPDLTESFGTDEATGRPCWTFLTEELPGLVEAHLGLRPLRESTFVAGNSMVGCGTEDTHLAENRRFVAAAEALGVPVITAFAPGGHDWRYWSRALVDVLYRFSASPTIASAARAPSSGLSGST